MDNEKKTVVALYDDATTARTMIEQLEDVGVPRQFLSIVGSDLGTVVGNSSGNGRVGYLTRLGIPKSEADLYVEHVSRGGTLIIARVSDAQVDGVISVLEQSTPVDTAQRATVDRQSSWSAQERTVADFDKESVREKPARHAPADSPDTSGSLSVGAPDLRDLDSGEQHIPIVEEEIQVGKRTVDRGGVRVRSFVVETPVQEQVVLRDETIRVERRHLDPDRPATEADFHELTVEVSEIDEEAVVLKRAEIVEEVIVRKDVEERLQTISDTVRRTEVAVEDSRTNRDGTGLDSTGR